MSYRAVESGAVAARQSKIARVGFQNMAQTTSATNFKVRRCAVRIWGDVRGGSVGRDDEPQSLTGLAAVVDRFALDSDQLQATSISRCH